MTQASLTDGERRGHLAEALAEVTGATVTVMPGALRVRELAAHWVDVVRVDGGWRAECTPKDALAPPGRCWSYPGGGWADLIRVVRAVHEWDGGDSTEPGAHAAQRGPEEKN